MQYLETDFSINEESRAAVARMKQEHGAAWLGIVNRYRDDERPWLWEWDGGLVLNFDAAFVLPAFDAELTRLLAERSRSPYEGTTPDAARLAPIARRIETLGGKWLVWA